MKKGQPGLNRKQIVLSQKSNETSFQRHVKDYFNEKLLNRKAARA